MASQSAEGIILRKFYHRETSFILIVFTKEYGKVRGVIKGVRVPYPQFAGNFEIFTKCRIEFYKKKRSSLDLITQCEAVETYNPARKAIERLTYANYFIELIDIVTADYDVNEELYQVLSDALGLLEGDSSAKRISRIFELKFLKALGLCPHLERCSACDGEIGEKIYFREKLGGALCASCGDRDPLAARISSGAINFMRKVISSDMSRTARFKVERTVGKEVEKALSGFLRYHIARPVKSMRFIDRLEKEGITL